MPELNNPQTIESYQAAIDFLYQFVNYERKMTELYAPEKMDPFRPAQLLYAVGDPHRNYPSIHIAGTKGKGSVAAICATALRAAGLRVGLYTSPHLQDLRERIRVLTSEDGQGYISENDFVRLVNELQPVTQTISALTWFELLTAMAFIYFAQQEVDVAVVEVGLGGRLDATNVLTPIISVITSLSLDHTGLLGNTLAEIAAEKGGIIKHGVPVVCAPQAPEALAVVRALAEERQAPLVLVGQTWQAEGQMDHDAGGACAQQRITITKAPENAAIQAGERLPLALNGAYQQDNALTALAALEVSRRYLPALTAEAMRAGLAEVQWPGRLQILHHSDHSATLLVDGAHNADSAEKLAQYLQQQCRYQQLWLVLGVTADKNVQGILAPLLPLADGAIVTRADNPRATPVEALREAAMALGYETESAETIELALRRAWELAQGGDLICVTGSLYIVGDLLNCWDLLKSDLLSESG